VASTDVTALQAPGDPAPLAARGVTRRFGDHTVLEDLDLTLGAGEVALVEGSNGAGKTTLLRIAAGLLAPDAGQVTVLGLDPIREREEYGRHIALLSAGDRGLYARLTVRQNLEFFAALALVPRPRRAGAIGQAVTRFSLEPLADRRVDRLSTGQRQRVRLAGALLHDPAVVLLDEPASSLDLDGMEHLRGALAEVTGRGGTVLWCAPSGTSASLPADRVYMLGGGALRSL
jgi:heme ABC exporter ATP-binding subunit CcmA